MVIKHDVQPNTKEWLELRKKYRTASEAAIVLGISPWTTPEDFKLIKAGLKKQYYNSKMRRGHELEDQVRQHASDFFGMDFKEAIYSNGNYLASLDGIADDIVLEIKVSDYTFKDLEDGDIPEYYHVQMQQQLFCSGARVAYLYVYSPERDEYICSHDVALDPGYMPKIELAWEQFDDMELPENAPLDRTGEAAVEMLFAEYAFLKGEAENIKEKMDKIKEQLLAFADDRTMVASDYTLQKSKPRITTDYRTACSDAKLDLSKYKKEGDSVWTIKLPKNPFA